MHIEEYTVWPRRQSAKIWRGLCGSARCNMRYLPVLLVCFGGTSQSLLLQRAQSFGLGGRPTRSSRSGEGEQWFVTDTSRIDLPGSRISLVERHDDARALERLPNVTREEFVGDRVEVVRPSCISNLVPPVTNGQERVRVDIP